MDTNTSAKFGVNNESSRSIKKAIIPIAGLGTRFLPLSKVLPKELWPSVDKPVIQYIIEEVKASGISQIIFVIGSEKKVVLDYFEKYYLKKSQKLARTLKERNKVTFLKELKGLSEICQDLSFSHVFQKKPLGDGHAILQAKKLVKDEPVAVSFGDDIVESEIPCLLQLKNIFKTAQKPVIALHRIPREKAITGFIKLKRLLKNQTSMKPPLI